MFLLQQRAIEVVGGQTCRTAAPGLIHLPFVPLQCTQLIAQHRVVVFRGCSTAADLAQCPVTRPIVFRHALHLMFLRSAKQRQRKSLKKLSSVSGKCVGGVVCGFHVVFYMCYATGL